MRPSDHPNFTLGRATQQFIYFFFLPKDKAEMSYFASLHLKGIQFFTERPSIYYGPMGSTDVAKSKRTSELLGLSHLFQSQDQIRQLYPYLNIGQDKECVIQQTQSGMVNPRKLVLAQKTAASLQGCQIVERVVEQICEIHLPSHGRCLRVFVENEQIIHAHKALVCTGVFTNFKSLLPKHLQPDIKCMPAQTLRIELADNDSHRLRNMPMLSNLAAEPGSDIYACPPVTYPDGKTIDIIFVYCIERHK